VQRVSDPPRFYYDLASPRAWLRAERVVEELGEVPEFVPVRMEPAGFRCAEEVAAHFEDIARQAQEWELLAVRPPPVFPADTDFAMLAATYARQIGKVVAFSLAAFRQAFCAGRDLGERETVLIAGAAAEIHPAALIKGAGLRATAQRLATATEEARAAGVDEVPAVVR